MPTAASAPAASPARTGVIPCRSTRPEHPSVPRSERDANADFRAPPRHGIRNHAISSECRQRERGDREQKHQRHLESPPRHRFAT